MRVSGGLWRMPNKGYSSINADAKAGEIEEDKQRRGGSASSTVTEQVRRILGI